MDMVRTGEDRNEIYSIWVAMMANLGVGGAGPTEFPAAGQIQPNISFYREALGYPGQVRVPRFIPVVRQPMVL